MTLRDLSDYAHAVYRVYDSAGRLLYVGATCDPEQRLLAHVHAAPWAGEYDDHTLTWHGSRAEALAAEAEAIRSERPVYNVKGQPAPEPVRVTLNIKPELYRQLTRWLESAAEAIDVPRVSQQDALRAMIWAVVNDGPPARTGQVSAAVLDELREQRA